MFLTWTVLRSTGIGWLFCRMFFSYVRFLYCFLMIRLEFFGVWGEESLMKHLCVSGFCLFLPDSFALLDPLSRSAMPPTLTQMCDAG